MKKHLYSPLIMLLLAILTSCDIRVEKTSSGSPNLLNPEEEFIGTFVSEEYEKRNSGADWVSVTIVQIRKNSFHVEIRSRSDVKKPTCTLTTDAHLNKKGELIASQNDLDIGFRISGDLLSIYSPSNQDLNYFCSGGATLVGKYKRISGKLDQKQVDPSQFWKFLEYDNMLFSVQAIRDTLTIQPSLPKGRAAEVKIPFRGSIANAEVADLNADGFPEVYVYIREGRDQHIHLEAYNLTNGNSLQKIGFDSSVMPEDEKKFYGRDEFKTNEKKESLQRLFPVKGTSNDLRVMGYILKTDGAVPELIFSWISTTNTYPW